MNKKNKWISYNNLAWTELLISSPNDYRKETELYCKIIMDNSKLKPKTLLHMGCGAGIYDHTFKKHFNVTGIDISSGMLKIARKNNPKVKYILGDMRNIKLDNKFDAVIIPDSIGYMTTVRDLNKTINTAYRYLHIGGVLLIVTHLRDSFNENNFVYTGNNKIKNITIFENNHIINKSNYEATIIYLIRHKNNLKIYTDIHTIGLFTLDTWKKLLKEIGFNIKIVKAENIYERFLLNDGDYPQQIFICKKSK